MSIVLQCSGQTYQGKQLLNQQPDQLLILLLVIKANHMPGLKTRDD